MTWRAKKAMVSDLWSRAIQRRIGKDRAIYIYPTLNGPVFIESEGNLVVSFGVYGGVVRYILNEPLSKRELGVD